MIIKAKALSIRQPWAWLIINGHKDVENRKWHSPAMGDIFIHASRTFDAAGYEWVDYHFPRIVMPEPEEFDFGGIVGTARHVETVENSSSLWFFGPYGFVFTNVRPCQLIPQKGALNFFDVGIPEHRIVRPQNV